MLKRTITKFWRQGRGGAMQCGIYTSSEYSSWEEMQRSRATETSQRRRRWFRICQELVELVTPRSTPNSGGTLTPYEGRPAHGQQDSSQKKKNFGTKVATDITTESSQLVPETSPLGQDTSLFKSSRDVTSWYNQFAVPAKWRCQ